MFPLKSISREAIPAALEKATRYRVLNEPAEAESICRDVLEVDPDNQEALVTLVLALTDEFPLGLGSQVSEPQSLVARLKSEYERAYYTGIIHERRGKRLYERGAPGCGHVAYESLRQAMEFYEKAERLRPPGNDDAVLRWNACARLIMKHPDLVPEEELEGGTPLQLE